MDFLSILLIVVSSYDNWVLPSCLHLHLCFLWTLDKIFSFDISTYKSIWKTKWGNGEIRLSKKWTWVVLNFYEVERIIWPRSQFQIQIRTYYRNKEYPLSNFRWRFGLIIEKKNEECRNRTSGHRNCFNNVDKHEKSALSMHAKDMHAEDFSLNNFREKGLPKNLRREEFRFIDKYGTIPLGMNRYKV